MRRFVVSLVLVLILAQIGTTAIANNAPNAADDAAIRQLLDDYAKSVSTGDRTRFESLLLNLKIPFSYVGTSARSARRPTLADFQDYAGFRATIFDGGKKYRQRFSHVSIEQVGDLAQVSLDYQTALQGEPYQGSGWKILQLVRVDRRWKIASEFFTGK
jgi:hypothetical protein